MSALVELFIRNDRLGRTLFPLSWHESAGWFGVLVGLAAYPSANERQRRPETRRKCQRKCFTENEPVR